MRIVPALLCATSLFAQGRAPEIESIKRDEMRADLFFLASDDMRGRLTDTPEYKLAAEWIISRFQRLGLLPAGENGEYYQEFELIYGRLGDGNRLLVGDGSSKRTARLREEFYPLLQSANGEAKGQAVLAGYGIRASEHNWDDYRGADVRGKLVLVFEGDPDPDNPESAFDGIVTSDYANSWSKALTAQEQGASGVLIIASEFAAGRRRTFAGTANSDWPLKPPRIERYELASRINRLRIPVIRISEPIAEHILGATLAPLRQKAGEGGSVYFPAPLSVEFTASVARMSIVDRNLLAKIEGADPQRKNEAVLVSAHHDHDGADGTQILNGADDNGSGTVAVLDIAEAYAAAARNGHRPARTVIFALWGSEERGLLGSYAWLHHPLWPLEKTIAALNMDMIGRSEEVPENGGRRFYGLKPQQASSNANSVHVMGYSFNPELAAMVKKANTEIDLSLRMDYDNNRSNLVRRSDQWPFLQSKVPALFFHTGLHPDYHRIGDRPEKIEYGKMERIARLVYQTSWDAATAQNRPRPATKRVIPNEQ
ncbi:MAG TPA: M28 family peptidase [Bryobacteraceae bacterium]|nr:M28 family peptidase [Bryobacteraceae bacterium]